MRIEILAAESLGVRGLCCVVQTHDHHIIIDPGLALGYKRAGLLPHPIQIAVGEGVRTQIIERLKIATDVVFSHFHGDHIPLADANPYQLPLQSVFELLQGPRLWVKGIDGEKPVIAERRKRLLDALKEMPPPCNGQAFDTLKFSETMPHGSPGVPTGTVMMTRIQEGSDVFVHASDIQLLSDEAVSKILEWRPTIVLASGPPVYRQLPQKEHDAACGRARAMAMAVRLCILDHHMLRCRAGIRWLNTLKEETQGRILCAADFMHKKRRFLEANRSRLYTSFPVPPGWHDSFHQKIAPAAEILST